MLMEPNATSDSVKTAKTITKKVKIRVTSFITYHELLVICNIYRTNE